MSRRFLFTVAFAVSVIGLSGVAAAAPLPSGEMTTGEPLLRAGRWSSRCTTT
jgi:hypothetical protein